jgi:hypothetical protein
MEMEMKHTLSAMRTSVDDQAEPSVVNPLQFRDLVTGQHQAAE